jgi:purine-binding chemotaxis protein CheW
MSGRPTTTAAGADLAVLTIMLGDQYYALPIDNVVEVAAMVELTTLANASVELLGAANRHGSVLPMLDLRTVLNHEHKPVDDTSLFVVAQSNDQMLGLVVDQILQVEYMTSSAIQIAGAGDHIRGVITVQGRMIQVLELASLINTYLSTSTTHEGMH